VTLFFIVVSKHWNISKSQFTLCELYIILGHIVLDYMSTKVYPIAHKSFSLTVIPLWEHFGVFNRTIFIKYQ